MNLTRKMNRRGDLYSVDINGERHPVGATDVKHTIMRVKSVDGWWQRRAAELAEKKRSVVPAKHPLDRRIERAIKKATSK